MMLRWIVSFLLVSLLAACVVPPTTPLPYSPAPYLTPAEPPATPYPTSGDNPMQSPTYTPASYPMQGAPTGYEPAPGDQKMRRSTVILTSGDNGVRIMESFPPQVILHLAGTLPNPCHQLRVAIQPPDAQKQIKIEVYSVVDPNMACIEVIQPFETNISLGTFESGRYSIWINNEKLADFEI